LSGQLPLKEFPSNLPPFNIDHLSQLTDDTGILQHATFTVPNRNHGYCTDDNARALIFALKAQQLSGITEADAAHLDSLSRRYLGFLLYAFNDENGRFRNLMSYSRDWLKSAGSEDSHGRALWALGSTASKSKKQSLV